MNCRITEDLTAAERERWIEFWNSSPRSHPRQHPDFAALEVSGGRKALFARIVGDDGRISAAAVLVLRSLLPGDRLSGEALCARGPVFDDVATGRALLEGIVADLRRRFAGCVRVSPYWIHPDALAVERMLADLGFHALSDDPRDHSGIVDLRRSEDEILARFSTSTRKDVRIAERKGVDTRPISREDEADLAFRCLTEHRRDRNLSPITREAFDRLFAQILREGRLGVVIGAMKDGKMLGVITIIRSGTTAHPSHYSIDSAAARSAGNLSVGPALWWKAMLWAKAQGCAFLDVEGNVRPIDPSHQRFELENFKRRFTPDPIERIAEHVFVCRPVLWTVYRHVERTPERWRRVVANVRRVLGPGKRGASKSRPIGDDAPPPRPEAAPPAPVENSPT